MKDKKSVEMDEREPVSIELTEQQFNVLARMSHERDITFNQLCNDILREQIEKMESENAV